MKIKIITLGDKPDRWIIDGFNEYKKRLSKIISFELIEIPIRKRTKIGNPIIWLKKEAKLIFSKINKSDYLIIMDVKSKIISTEELAYKIENWILNNINIVILIGGPDGLHQNIKDIAKEKISISKMTLPHTIVRIIIAEQIYRAYTILEGHPYHK